MAIYERCMDIQASELKVGMRLGRTEVSFIENIGTDFVFIKTEDDEGYIVKNNWLVPVFMYVFEDFEYLEPVRNEEGEIVKFNKLCGESLVERMRVLGRIDSLLPMIV